MTDYYIVLDVGGTEIKFNALSSNGTFLYKEYHHAPSFAQESKSVICGHLFKLIDSVYKSFHPEDFLLGIAFAFPGPFDYEAGISFIKGQRKYDALYGVNLKEKLNAYLRSHEYPHVPILFNNDATSFAYGEFIQSKNIKRGIYITIGTGCGSGFVNEGYLVKSGYHLNSSGMIYDIPFKDGIIDQYVSANGLEDIARKLNYPFENGKELADAARKGDRCAKQIYHSFGKLIGEALQPFIKDFRPDEVVFGGQISKSFNLFEAGIKSEWGPFQPRLRQTKDTTMATFQGLYHSSIN